MYSISICTYYPVLDVSLADDTVAFRERETGRELHRTKIGFADITLDNLRNIVDGDRPRVDCDVAMSARQFESFSASREIWLGPVEHPLDDPRLSPNPMMLKNGFVLVMERRFTSSALDKLKNRSGKQTMLLPSHFILGAVEEHTVEFEGDVLEFAQLADGRARITIELVSDLLVQMTVRNVYPRN